MVHQATAQILKEGKQERKDRTKRLPMGGEKVKPDLARRLDVVVGCCYRGRRWPELDAQRS